MMQGARVYPATALREDTIIVSVATRDRLRALGLGSYDAAINALLSGAAGAGRIRAAFDGVAARDPARNPGQCPSLSPMKIRGENRPCRVRGPHEVHRYWSPYDQETSW